MSFRDWFMSRDRAFKRAAGYHDRMMDAVEGLPFNENKEDPYAIEEMFKRTQPIWDELHREPWLVRSFFFSLTSIYLDNAARRYGWGR